MTELSALRSAVAPRVRRPQGISSPSGGPPAGHPKPQMRVVLGE